MTRDNLYVLEEKLGYRFNERSLIENALCHSSFVNEQPDPRPQSNERLEFLGDAVMNLAIGHVLMDRYSSVKEGELSRMRASLVNESTLAVIARNLDLGSHLRLGKGELLNSGREKASILADALEALMAAVYKDSGLDAVIQIVHRLFSEYIVVQDATAIAIDYKTSLQERVQAKYRATPKYHVIRESGPDHDKTFVVRVTAAHIEAEGSGKSKKNAEQEAARAGLDLIAKALSTEPEE